VEFGEINLYRNVGIVTYHQNKIILVWYTGSPDMANVFVVIFIVYCIHLYSSVARYLLI
jgi:hypothetical protein